MQERPQSPTDSSGADAADAADAAGAAESRSRQLGPSDAGRRLDLWLADFLGVSRREVRRLLERGGVRLDERRLRLRDKGLPLPASGVLSVESFTPACAQRVAPDLDAAGTPLAPPRILSHGEGWLAVDKPAGMPVHPLREGERGSVLSRLIAHHPQIEGVGEGGLRSGVVHRLDVETSGVLLVATSEAGFVRLREAFRLHRVEKLYRALVAGTLRTGPAALELELRLEVACHRPARVRVVPESEPDAPGIRRVRQSVRTLEELPGATLVEVRPRSGHLHQIRASLAYLGHPVLADRVYAPASAGAPSQVEAACGASRHLLHAARVVFEEVCAESPDPEDLRAALARLRAQA